MTDRELRKIQDTVLYAFQTLIDISPTDAEDPVAAVMLETLNDQVPVDACPFYCEDPTIPGYGVGITLPNGERIKLTIEAM